MHADSRQAGAEPGWQAAADNSSGISDVAAVAGDATSVQLRMVDDGPERPAETAGRRDRISKQQQPTSKGDGMPPTGAMSKAMSNTRPGFFTRTGRAEDLGRLCWHAVGGAIGLFPTAKEIGTTNPGINFRRPARSAQFHTKPTFVSLAGC